MRRKTESGKGRSTKSIIALVIVVALSGAALLNWKTLTGLLTGGTEREERAALEEKIAELEARLAEREAAQEAEPAPTAAPSLGELTGGPQQAAVDTETRCAALEQKILDYFEYLDGQEYVMTLQLPGGALGYFRDTLGKLYAKPPTVVREADSLSTILGNSVHFYRVLGKQGIGLARGILLRDRDIIEPGLALLYQWMGLARQCEASGLAISLPLAELYEYAGFFLNTFGGHSYLLRRTPPVRTLTRYYSVLILDQANDRSLNRYGLDIRPFVTALVHEVENSRELLYGRDYLQTLRALEAKYRSMMGSPSPAAP